MLSSATLRFGQQLQQDLPMAQHTSLDKRQSNALNSFTQGTLSQSPFLLAQGGHAFIKNNLAGPPADEFVKFSSGADKASSASSGAPRQYLFKGFGYMNNNLVDSEERRAALRFIEFG